MKKTRFNEIEKMTGAWEYDKKVKFGGLQDFAAFIKHINDSDISVDEVVEYVEEHKHRVMLEEKAHEKKTKAAKDRWRKKVRKCPECGKPLNLGSVGENIKEYNHQWFCLEDDCKFVEEFGTETVQEIIEQLGV